MIASACIGATSLMSSMPASAQDTTMRLIQMMHENGSITDAQYQQLQAAAAQEAQAPQSSQMAHSNGGPNTSTPLTASTTPINTTDDATFQKKVADQFASLAWLDKVKLTGDLRLRYEYNSNNNGLASALAGDSEPDRDRSRGRFRYRLGIITTPLDNLEVGAGLASGSNDPRSTNQTFGGDFATKAINLDYAYAKYDFSPYLTNGFELSAIGGKFKFGDYLSTVTDAMWDDDIRPEGAAVHLAKSESVGKTYLNSAVLVIDENGSTSEDPYLWYVQGGQNFAVNNFIASVSGTYYSFDNTFTPDGVRPDTVLAGAQSLGGTNYGAGTNTTSQFSVVNVDATIGTKFTGGKAELVGQVLKNVHSDVSQDEGFAGGARVGFDPWSMQYLYVDLDRNVVPDTLPDSDRFNGATGIKGHEVVLAYALNSNIGLGLDYYNVQTKFANERQNLIQSDLSFKF